MNITIKTIPHAEQRYPTVGDWWFDDAGNLEIRVSDMSDWRYEALVAFHELAEVLLCKQHGVTQDAVDAFDMAFEGDGEPGNDPAAPYVREHFAATALELFLCNMMKLSWDAYGETVEALP